MAIDHGPLEWEREKKIKLKLRSLGWFVMKMHGNEFQQGFPDLFCTHPTHRIRLIEVKRYMGASFTPAQHKTFPLISAHGAGIWVLIDDSDEEINKLFRPPNWEIYRIKSLIG